MKHHKLRTSIEFSILFLIFLAIMDYPFVARMINASNQGNIAFDYEECMQTQDDEEKQNNLEAAKAYNAELANGIGNTLSGTEVTAADSEYMDLLNFDDNGVMGMLEIPKIHVSLMIYHGSDQETLEKGVGHLEGTSLPIGGKSTHASMSAHRGMVGKKMFTDLDQLELGDIFLVHILDETLCYRVCDIKKVLPEEIQSLQIREGEDLVTLITCTPYGINTQRLLVEGKRIPYSPDVAEEIIQKEKQANLRDWWWVGLSAVFFLFMIVLLVWYNKRGEGK